MSNYISLHMSLHICSCTCRYTCHHSSPYTCHGTCCHTLELDNDAFVPLLDLANVFMDVVLGAVAARHFSAVHLESRHTCTMHTADIQRSNLRHRSSDLQPITNTTQERCNRQWMCHQCCVAHAQQPAHMQHAHMQRHHGDPPARLNTVPLGRGASNSLCHCVAAVHDPHLLGMLDLAVQPEQLLCLCMHACVCASVHTCVHECMRARVCAFVSACT